MPRMPRLPSGGWGGGRRAEDGRPESGRQPETMGVVEGTFPIAGLLLALQTQFEFVRDKDGRWAVKIKKKGTSEALLKPLVKKLTELLGG